jgi:hypothetical protein
MTTITHYTVEEGGEFYPAATIVHKEFFALRFADGSVWDRVVGWRGPLFPRPSIDQDGNPFIGWGPTPSARNRHMYSPIS